MNDVNSSEVDHKLQQQSAVARTTEHYRQHVAPSMPSMSGASGGTSIWNTPFVTAAVFGLIGGLCAWFAGELVFLAIPDQLDEFTTVDIKRSAIIEDANRGELSQVEASQRVTKLLEKYRDNPYVKIYTDQTQSESDRTRLVEEQIEKDKPRNFILQLIWFSVLGISISLCLAISDGVAGRNWRACIINGSVGITLGLVGGIVVGLFINQLYAALGGGIAERTLARQIFARAIGWAILGLFLAIAPGIVLRNLKRSLIGVAGGFLGGLLGGLLFDPIGMGTGNATVSRLIAIIGIGVIAGLGTGFLENVTKTGWLKVVGGLIAGKQFILYKNPTMIGSSPQCEVYLFKDIHVAPQHAAIRQVPQGYEIQDMGSSSGTFVNGSPISRVRLKNNDQIQIGGTVFLFQEKTKTHS